MTSPWVHLRRDLRFVQAELPERPDAAMDRLAAVVEREQRDACRRGEPPRVDQSVSRSPCSYFRGSAARDPAVRRVGVIRFFFFAGAPRVRAGRLARDDARLVDERLPLRAAATVAAARRDEPQLLGLRATRITDEGGDVSCSSGEILARHVTLSHSSHARPYAFSPPTKPRRPSLHPYATTTTTSLDSWSLTSSPRDPPRATTRRTSPLSSQIIVTLTQYWSSFGEAVRLPYATHRRSIAHLVDRAHAVEVAVAVHVRVPDGRGAFPFLLHRRTWRR